MSSYPNCPKCSGEYVYEDGELFICPECGYEWSKNINNLEESGLKVV